MCSTPAPGGAAYRLCFTARRESTSMDSFLHATILITIGEMGDKTQLLAMMLVARYLRIWPLLLGILLATFLNHALAVALGEYMGNFMTITWVRYALPTSFILIGLWMLHPDNIDKLNVDCTHGPFYAALTMFFMAEMGDKTQIATIALAAEYHQYLPVLLGTTTGMILANLPALFFGRAFLARINVKYMQILAALLFIGSGVVELWPLLGG